MIQCNGWAIRDIPQNILESEDGYDGYYNLSTVLLLKGNNLLALHGNKDINPEMSDQQLC